jgi:hypothetical protein
MNFIRRKYYQLYISLLQAVGASEIIISKTKYLYKNNKVLNLDKPTEFMEKIQWLKFNYYTEKFGYLVDKYEVREFVEKTIGAQYLNEFITVYNSVDEINLDTLPNQFALKGTHGSGYNIIVEDKSKLNWNKAKKELTKYLKEDYSKINGEAIYRAIQPRILAEEYLCQSDGNYIVDYKFFCFHGVAKYVWVKTFSDGKYRNCYYDLKWNKIQNDLNKSSYLDVEMAKPDNFDEMIEISNKLSKDFIFVRVDLYSIKSKIYFGELTFFPWGGKQRLTVDRFNQEFGDLIRLPEINN